jgi:hypothetical protein
VCGAEQAVDGLMRHRVSQEQIECQVRTDLPRAGLLVQPLAVTQGEPNVWTQALILCGRMHGKNQQMARLGNADVRRL